jgi:diguanylate cyclase (GGDEF)-like protein
MTYFDLNGYQMEVWAHEMRRIVGAWPMAGTKRNLRGLVVAVLLIFVCSAGAVGITIVQLRDDAIQAAIADTTNIATVLSGQFARSIQSVDLVLNDVRTRIQELGYGESRDMRRTLDTRNFHDALRERLARLPQASIIAVTDEHGKIIVTTARWPVPGINISDRDYFKELQAATDDKLSISLPFVNVATGVNTIAYARRLVGNDGNFIGMVFVGMNTEYIRSVFDSVGALQDLNFALLRADRRLILSYPSSELHVEPLNDMNSKWQLMVAAGGGSFLSSGRQFGVPRYVAVRPLVEYPLVIHASIAQPAALARWRQRALSIGFGTLVVLCCSIGLLIAVVRQFRRLGASQASMRENSRRLKSANMRFDAALNNMSQGLCLFDVEHNVVVVNERYRQIYGLAPDQVQVGTSLRQILEYCRANGTYDGPGVDEYVARHRRSSLELRQFGDGRVISILHHALPDGGCLTTHEDITDRQRTEAKIAYMAHHDLLTGLANRTLFSDRIEEAGARLQRRGEVFAVLMLDLDRFKHVNDTLGHPIGDLLLKEAAQRVKSALRQTDVLARLGGDEFAIIQTSDSDTDQRSGATVLANRIIDQVTKPFDIDGHRVSIGTSIGIALAPTDGIDPSELMKKADMALYRAKAEGRNCSRFFDPAMTVESDARQQLEDALRQAIEQDELELHYQPVVDAQTRQICAMEALVRWRHPVRGLLYPDQFIGLAEESGLIVALGAWVLQRACTDAATWPSHIRIAVNVSAVQLKKRNLLDLVMCAMVECGLLPGRLELEITETALIQNDADDWSMMHQLKNIGVEFALDDFGTGYSSLSNLTTFPFDRIKIDRSFTHNMSKRVECAAVVSAALTLARALSIHTTAEGVETEEQAEILRAAGVECFQGYLFGRPRPLAEIQRPGHDQPGMVEAAA